MSLLQPTILNLRLKGLGDPDLIDDETPLQLAVESFDDTPPGIDPITARVITAAIEGVDVVAQVELNPRDYLKQQIQYGVDVYEVLQELKPQLSREALQELVEWFKSANLTVAYIEVSLEGIDSWQEPARGL